MVFSHANITDKQGKIKNKHLLVIKMQNMYNHDLRMRNYQNNNNLAHNRSQMDVKKNSFASQKVDISPSRVKVISEHQVKKSIFWFQEKMLYFAKEFESDGVLNPLARKVIMNTGYNHILVPLKHKYFNVRCQQYETMLEFFNKQEKAPMVETAPISI